MTVNQHNLMDSIEPLLQLYRRFCELAGTDPLDDLRFHKFQSRCFYEFVAGGFNEQEMVLVIQYVQAQNKKATAPEYRRKIVPSKILGDLERFCEDLAEAKRLQALRVSPRQQAINEFRRCPAPESIADTSRTIKDILRSAIDP